MRRHSTSANSASRFLALRETSRPHAAPQPAPIAPPTTPAAPKPRRLRPRADAVPAPWHYVESCKPGVFAEWVRDVGLPWEGYTLGVTRSEPWVSAQAAECRSTLGRQCTRCFAHCGGKWRAVTHPVWPMPPADPEPRIEEHW